jgi:hypothetical protein
MMVFALILLAAVTLGLIGRAHLNRRRGAVALGVAALAALVVLPAWAEVTVHGSPAFKKQVADCFAKFRTNDPENIIGTLEKSKFVHDVMETNVPKGSTENPVNAPAGRAVGDGGTGKGTSSNITWNPTDTSNYEPGVPRDPCSALYHELYHSYEDDQGVSVYAKYGGAACVQQVELNATIAQNEYLRAIGKPVRTNYSGLRLCSKTIVNPPTCPPGAVDPKYCTPGKPRPAHVFSAKAKLELKRAAIVAAIHGFGARLALGINQLLPARFRFLTPDREQFLRVYAGAASLLASAYRFLAITIDPPDFNVGKVAKPHPPAVPHSQAGPGISAHLAAALNAFATNAAMARGVATALSTAINRASGAAILGDGAALKRQLRAAKTYARKEAKVLRADIRLRKRLERVLTGTPATPKITPGLLKALNRRRLPSALARVLRALGYSDADLRSLRRQLEHESMRSLAGTRALLRLHALNVADRGGAGALRALAVALAHG